LWEGAPRTRVLPEVLSANLTVRVQLYRNVAFTAARFGSASSAPCRTRAWLRRPGSPDPDVKDCGLGRMAGPQSLAQNLGEGNDGAQGPVGARNVHGRGGNRPFHD
jgi:hypothetical protein